MLSEGITIKLLKWTPLKYLLPVAAIIQYQVSRIKMTDIWMDKEARSYKVSNASLRGDFVVKRDTQKDVKDAFLIKLQGI